jgi:hypothetical protein
MMNTRLLDEYDVFVATALTTYVTSVLDVYVFDVVVEPREKVALVVVVASAGLDALPLSTLEMTIPVAFVEIAPIVAVSADEPTVKNVSVGRDRHHTVEDVVNPDDVFDVFP